MKIGTKIFLGILGAAVLAVGIYQLYLLLHFRLYKGYQEYLPAAYTFEEGTEFKALAGANPALGEYVLAAENDTLTLWVNQTTAAAAVVDKRTGEITHTNPPAADDDPVALPGNKTLLKSQIVIDYFNSSRVRGTYYSYDMSVLTGQVEFVSLKDGFRAVYTFGKPDSPTGILPPVILKSRLEAFVADAPNKDTLLGYYEPYPGKSGVLQLKAAIKSNKTVLNRVIATFTRMGYTQEDFDRDVEDADVDFDVPLSFTVPLDYRLDGDSLLVTVPADKIEERGGGAVVFVTVLPYMSAAGADDSGYMFVPNGSGSLIKFNNGKTLADDYTQYIYDLDPLFADYAVLGNTVTARLPYFGFSFDNGRNVLAKIEKGDTLAQLYAGVAGKITSYNFAYASFRLRGAMALTMFGVTGNEADLPLIEPQHYMDELSVRYSFLDESHKGYSGMAAYAREKLTEQDELTKLNATDNIPFYADLVASVQTRKFVGTIPYNGLTSVTTYKQAQEISDGLKSKGIGRQVLNLQGWFNRGYYHDAANHISPTSGLGSIKTLEELKASVESDGGRLYSDTIFQKVPFTPDGHGFYYPLETSKYYSGYVASFGKVDPISLYEATGYGYSDNYYNALSPKFINRYADTFLNKFAKYGKYFSGVSLRDLGSYIVSDRRRTEIIERESAKSLIEAAFDKIGAKYPMMVSGGNFYAIGGADDLINVPDSHNAFYIVDEEVPFYEMLVHGSVNYAGDAVNLSDSYDQDMIALRMIEFGAYPHFTFTAEDSSLMKYSAPGAAGMYSTTFASWLDTAAAIYAQVDGALAGVTGEYITEHAEISEGVRRVTYSDGTKIYVNYNDSTGFADGIEIPAKGVAVREG